MIGVAPKCHPRGESIVLVLVTWFGENWPETAVNPMCVILDEWNWTCSFQWRSKYFRDIKSCSPRIIVVLVLGVGVLGCAVLLWPVGLDSGSAWAGMVRQRCAQRNLWGNPTHTRARKESDWSQVRLGWRKVVWVARADIRMSGDKLTEYPE